MRDQFVDQSCACRCGESGFGVSGVPVTRFFCHCTICQAIYRQPFADVTAFWARDVSIPADHKIQFKKYRAPPALKRGTCASCGAPVVGFLRLAPFVQLAFVPSQNIPDQPSLPAPRGRVFYHRRTKDETDELPRISGYWPSEWAVTRWVLGSVL